MIVEAELSHVAMMAPLRPNEAALLEGLGTSLEKVVEHFLGSSCEAWSAIVEDRVAVMWGFQQQTLLGGAHVWLIPTEIVTKRPREFLIESRNHIRGALERYPYIYGFTNPKFEKACRWMEWLGFKLTERETLNRYEMRA